MGNLREFAKYSPQSLLALMDEMSQEARSKGMTPELLESLLADEDRLPNLDKSEAKA